MFNRWEEFFEDGNGYLSMSRLLCFLSFFPATFLVVHTLSVDALGWYIGGYVIGYIGGKGVDIYNTRKYEENDQVWRE